MKRNNYSKIKAHIESSLAISDDFFVPGFEKGKCFIFVISCLNDDKFLYHDDTFESLTGYPIENIIKGGMNFWMSLIHPEDNKRISGKIIEAHKVLFTETPGPERPEPLRLTYRIKHADGEWIWIKDIKYLISSNPRIIDKVLGKYEQVFPDTANDPDLNVLFQNDESCTKLLEVALLNQNSQEKQLLGAPSETNKTSTLFVPKLTKRETEILRLIANGLSTKLIADKCHISIHTVETHRRHLLEKLDVRNSMELVKKASKIFWL